MKFRSVKLKALVEICTDKDAIFLDALKVFIISTVLQQANVQLVVKDNYNDVYMFPIQYILPNNINLEKPKVLILSKN